MALVPWRPMETWWNPIRDLEKFQDDMNRIFGTLPSRADRSTGLLEGDWSPAIDVYDSQDNIMVKADIPGMKKEDIDVTIQGDTLIIKGEKKIENDVKEEDYLRTERFYGSFNRTLTLPASVDQNKVNATYKGGVLELVLSKKEEEKPKRIEVNVK